VGCRKPVSGDGSAIQKFCFHHQTSSSTRGGTGAQALCEDLSQGKRAMVAQLIELPAETPPQPEPTRNLHKGELGPSENASRRASDVGLQLSSCKSRN
jgi:hypothetical protein